MSGTPCLSLIIFCMVRFFNHADTMVTLAILLHLQFSNQTPHIFKDFLLTTVLHCDLNGLILENTQGLTKLFFFLKFRSTRKRKERTKGQKVIAQVTTVDNQVIGPYFSNQTLTFLELEQITELSKQFPAGENHRLSDRLLYFQQDGALPHFFNMMNVIILLQLLPNRWVERRSAIE